MKPAKALTLAVICAVTLTACAAGTWSVFHANAQNEGFLAIHTADDVSRQEWALQVGSVGMNSPVLGIGYTIFIGNLNGELYDVVRPGTVAWKVTPAPGEMIIGSPAFGPDNRVYVVTMRQPDTSPRSTLHGYTSDGQHLWSYDFGADGGWSTASPKVWVGQGGTYVFLYVHATAAGRLYVIQDGRQVTHADVCGNLIQGGTRVNPRTGLPHAQQKSGAAPTDGYPDPTIAVISNPAFTPADEPLLIVANNDCSVAAFRLTANRQLAKLWEQTDNGLMKTSPGVSGGVIAVGLSDNQLVAYSLRDGTEQFRYDVGEPIWGSPAMAGIEIFAASLHALHVVDFNGNLLHKTALSGSTNSSSPAVSLDRVFVSADQGLGSYSWDLSNEIVHTEYRGGVSSPAIMSLGFVVLVTQDGYLRALTPR
jgi:outer membrane protein assembly factor BamB